ncbi:MAG TPA: aminodeoxychorismate/anthranilate synthase component II [Beijerinckiaceae bacterium]|nr:aminodeoxychorismate/anthranilate synthase component II [Beijerinckiaceae bacterium]
MARILLVDNYDSFTWNLVHCLGALGAEVTVRRNDEVEVSEALESDLDAIVLSPGPCTPKDAGCCVELIRVAGEIIPTFGVCLGHQAIGEAYGALVTRAPVPVHGKTSEIAHDGRTVFRGLEGPFQATRYHSLVVDRASLPDDLEVTAQTRDELIMGLSHRRFPVHGVQFHPESILSEHGSRIVQNFLDLARDWNEQSRTRRS